MKVEWREPYHGERSTIWVDEKMEWQIFLSNSGVKILNLDTDQEWTYLSNVDYAKNIVEKIVAKVKPFRFFRLVRTINETAQIALFTDWNTFIGCFRQAHGRWYMNHKMESWLAKNWKKTTLKEYYETYEELTAAVVRDE